MNGRWVIGRETAADALEQRGCGAWVGDGICGERATTRVFGGTDLLYATYLAATERPGLTHAFLCGLHHPGEGRVNGRLIGDMRRDILRDQRREFDKFVRRSLGHTMNRPNLMWP
jgi:hypothetical protein